MPRLSLNPERLKLLRDKSLTTDLRKHLRRDVESARFLIESIEQRRRTLERVAHEIIKRQGEFLEHGADHLKPLKMQEIADELGIHVSTVSRALKGKYIQTPQGIFDMKRFFSGGTETDSGQMISQQAVKDTIRKIVDQEDKRSPRSDDDLVAELARQGIHIARRTVTKYRKALGIDSSTRRKLF